MKSISFFMKEAIGMLPSALLFIGSILFIGAGIFCIAEPAESLLAVGYYIGFVLVLGGVCQILRWMKTEGAGRSLWHLLMAVWTNYPWMRSRNCFLVSGKLQNCLALHTYKTIIRIIRKDMIS